MSPRPTASPVAGVLVRPADIGADGPDGGGGGGAVWRLAESGRQLDADVVRVPPGSRIDSHAETDLDVLLYVIGGGGELETPAGAQPLEPGCVAWLPHGARWAVSAGAEGLLYLTAHRRSPGLGIRTAPAGAAAPAAPVVSRDEGGEAACLLSRICPGCDRPAEDIGARFCSRCGTALPVA
ncbi:cupin domain-containing protein [Streptomyces sp. NPDC006798]|uniref:cupin domain-containing protein n=1 Tax=Streptomyces sp. NPDC006798 TaxID=3155462 RepID=UPI0033D702ED